MMIFQFCYSSHIYQLAFCKEDFLPSFLHYHLVSWILLLFSGLRSIIVIFLLKAKIVKIQPVGTHSIWFLCLFDMSHHFQSTYLLSGTTNVPFLPYTTKWLFLHIPLGGHLKTIPWALDVFCITGRCCFCRGSFHWLEQGNIL